MKATGTENPSYLYTLLKVQGEDQFACWRRRMVSNETCAVNSLDTYNGLFIFATAPHHSCLQCERPLKPRYGGLCIWFYTYPCPLLLAVCASCQAAAIRDLGSGGRQFKVISPNTMESILNEDRILAFAQVRRWADGVLLEPYPI